MTGCLAVTAAERGEITALGVKYAKGQQWCMCESRPDSKNSPGGGFSLVSVKTL